LKSFQGAPSKVKITVIEPDKVISQPILWPLQSQSVP
jgi:hypothetical protein